MIMASFLTRWFKSKKEKEQGTNPEEEQSPPTVAPLKRVQNFCIKKMLQEGFNDATMYQSMREGLVNIKQQGLLLCDEAISEIKTDIKFITADEQIKQFVVLEQPVAAAKVKSFKDQKELEISMIEEKKKQLEENENLPVYVTYRQGFNKGKVAIAYAMSNEISNNKEDAV